MGKLGIFFDNLSDPDYVPEKIVKIPEIDKKISMEKIVGHTFRIHDFDRNGSVIDSGGQVKPKGRFSPYGYLVVSSPLFEGVARLRIIHRDDFFLASSIFDDDQLSPLVEKSDFLVTYLPKEHSKGYSMTPHHVLHYVLAPKGTLEEYYFSENKKHFIEPEPEKTGANVQYEGEIRVKISKNVDLNSENESLEKQVEENGPEAETNPNRTGRFHEYSKTMKRVEAIDVYKMWLLHVRYYHPKLDALFQGVSIPTFFLPVPMELLQEAPEIIKEFADEDGFVWKEELMEENLEKYASRYYPRTGDDEEIIRGLAGAICNENSLINILIKIKENKEDWYFEYKEL